jgi:hypothetical protein
MGTDPVLLVRYIGWEMLLNFEQIIKLEGSIDQHYYHKSLGRKNVIWCFHPRKTFNWNLSKKIKKFKCKANKMQQWLILKHVGFLQWPIRFQALNSINKLQMSFAFIFLYFVISYVTLKYMCLNFLQCWWE